MIWQQSLFSHKSKIAQIVISEMTATTQQRFSILKNIYEASSFNLGMSKASLPLSQQEKYWTHSKLTTFIKPMRKQVGEQPMKMKSGVRKAYTGRNRPKHLLTWNKHCCIRESAKNVFIKLLNTKRRLSKGVKSLEMQDRRILHCYRILLYKPYQALGR